MVNHELIGRYIVSDPYICHGKPTFRGTRILVSQVLEQVAAGMVGKRLLESSARMYRKRPLAWL